jgi:hypothetical protein
MSRGYNRERAEVERERDGVLIRRKQRASKYRGGILIGRARCLSRKEEGRLINSREFRGREDFLMWSKVLMVQTNINNTFPGKRIMILLHIIWPW